MYVVYCNSFCADSLIVRQTWFWKMSSNSKYTTSPVTNTLSRLAAATNWNKMFATIELRRTAAAIFVLLVVLQSKDATSFDSNKHFFLDSPICIQYNM